MARTQNPPLSVAQVLEIVPAEDSWVNDGFTAVVRSVKPAPPNAAKRFWKCVLADTTGSATINMTMFTAPKFSEGDCIDVLGQGIKRKEFNGQAEVSVGQKTEIHIIGKQVKNQEPGVPGAGAREGVTDPVPKGDFHKAMKRQALLYLHCLDYAGQIAAKHHTGTGLTMTDEQRQACTSSLFIEANREGLAGLVPPIGSAPVAPIPKAAPKPAPPVEDPDSDIPF